MESNEVTNEITKPKSTIKENWLKTDIKCESCGAIKIRAKGITRENMQRLFSFNYKNVNEWIWIVVILGLCFTAWAYKADRAAYADFMEHRVEYCMQLNGMNSVTDTGYWANSGVNISKLDLSRMNAEKNVSMEECSGSDTCILPWNE